MVQFGNIGQHLVNMVLNIDDGHKLLCPKCRGVIHNKEQVGIVDDGNNIWHSDCWKDRFGPESAYDDKMFYESDTYIAEMLLNMSEKERRRERLRRYRDFANLPPNKHGARKIA